MSLRKHLCCSLLLLCACSFSFGQKSASSENDLKKKAEKVFNEEKYEDATAMYSQLLSLYPQNPIYNYRYGVCLLMSGKDKTQASGYLETAMKNLRTVPEVHFYLGRSYIYAGHYNEAISEFDQFKKIGNTTKVSKLKVDLFIENCKNAIELNKNRRNISVVSQKEVTRNTFFTNYDFKNASGKLLTTADNFLTPKDKEKMNFPVMFMAKDGQTIFYASYGKKGDNGKDIFKITKMPDGSWSEQMNLGGVINTDENEDFPYMDKDSKTLYFCSKGHNSIGGYDIFKSVYDFNTGEWSKPVNLGLPINSPDDDIFYVPNIAGDQATYSTAVESEAGKISIRSIKLGDVIADVAVINGVYISKDQAMRRDARISVVDETGNGLITSVHTNPKTGEYELVLPSGANYMLVVDGGSYLPHAEYFEIPKTVSGLNLRQRVLMNKDGQKEQMTLSNFFSPTIANAKIENEKPTEVKSSNIIAGDMDSTKMKPVTIEGKTVYVTSPSALSASQNKTVAISTEKKYEHAEQPIVKGDKNEIPGEQIKDSTEQQLTLKQNISTEIEPPLENKSEEVKTEPYNAKPAITEKTSNPELVKMTFTEAYTLKGEAEATKTQATQKKEEAQALDSLSKSQLTHAEKLLTSDKELSKRLFSESKENSTQAESKMKEATALESEAKEKDQEADQSIQEATRLMKELKVDTHTVAYHSIPKSNLSKSKTKSTKKETTLPPSVVTTQPSTTEPTDTSKSQPLATTKNEVLKTENKNDTIAHSEEKEIAKVTSPVNEHRFKAEKLVAESQKLSSQSYEQSQMASTSNDKKEKAKFENQAKELKKQSDLKKSEADKELVLAQKEEIALLNVAMNKPASPTTASEKEKPGVNKAMETKNNNATTSENKNKSDTTSQFSITESKSDKNGLKEKPLAENKASNELPAKDKIVATTPLNEKGKASSQNEPTQNKETTSSELKEKTNPEAEKQYNSYLEKLSQSKAAEKQIDEIRNKIEASNTNNEKDSLITKANELSKESIARWQEAQIELDKAKSIDPDIERKSGRSLELKSSSDLANSNVVNKTESEVNKDPDSKNLEIKTENIANTTSITNENKTSNVETVEILDTTRTEYPKYKELQKQIQEKQTETVNVFIEGMQINKRAIVLKEEELKLRDKAQVETNQKKKNQLLAKADSVKFMADSLTNVSKNKLLEAKQNTGTVKSLTVQSDELKKALIVKAPSDKPTSTTTLAENKDNKANKKSSESLNANEKDPVLSPSQPSLTTNNNESKKPSESLKADEKTPAKLAPQLSLADKNKENKKSQESSKTEEKATTKSSSQPYLVDKAQETKPTSAPANVGKKTVAEHLTPESAQSTLKDVPEKKESVQNVAAKKESKTAHTPSSSVPPASSEQKILPTEYSPSEAQTFSLTKGSTDHATNKIPMDPALPEGLVFKVQIGAFKNPLPGNTFGNLQPLSSETTRPGWIRYCLGLFRSFEPANLLKKEVHGMGYRDAFVVAYFNGKRISLNEAYQMMSKASANEKQTYAEISNKEFKHLAQFRIQPSNFDNKPDNDTKSFYGTTEIFPDDLIEYAVQVGAYKTSKVPSALNALLPLNAEKTSRGIYRFTTGRFTNYTSADSMKKVAVNTGVKDAFIVIYKGGSKISGSEAASALNKGKSSPPVKESTITSTPSAPPISSNAPRIAAEEISSSDVIFKVQLGAFRESVPTDMVNSFLQISDKGITQETDSRGLHIFYAGQYKSYDDVLAAKTEVIGKGIKDAFVVAFAKGKRISITEAVNILNRK